MTDKPDHVLTETLPAVRWCMMYFLALTFFTPYLLGQGILNKGIDLRGLSTDYSSLPFIDLDTQTWRQVVVDREPGVYLGHPTTFLQENGVRPGHVFMTVAGLRLDTGWGGGRTGPRWKPMSRPAKGHVMRHPDGY